MTTEETYTVTEDIGTTNWENVTVEGGADGGNSKVYTIVLYVLVGSVGIVGNTLVCVVFGLMRSRRSQVNLFIFHQAFIDLCTSCLLITFGVTQLYEPEIMNRSFIEVVVPLNSSSSSPGSVSTLGPNATTTVTSTLLPHDEPHEIVLVEVANISFALAEFMCRLWWARVFLFSMFAISTFNLTTMALERYIAIMHPFFYATKFKRGHAFAAMLFIWVFGPVMQYFPAIFQYHAFPDTHLCGDQSTWTSHAQAAMGVCLITWEFFLPCIIMGFSSIRIFLKLRRRDTYLVKATNFLLRASNRKKKAAKVVNTVDNRPSETLKANRNTTMVVIIIFVVYMVCWAPNHLTFLGFNLGMELDFTGKWYHTTVLLAFVNSCINPFIYAIRLKTFQRGLVHVCRSGCKPMNSANFDSTAMASHYDVNASVI